MGYWGAFAQGVRRFGPVGIYGHDFRVPVYNHGPLAGWMLEAINWLLDRGITSFQFLIRVPACLADFVTALLVFELVRVVRPAREAAIAAVLVVCSPVLFVISGFHGNTDPVFVMFALLSVYLLIVRGWALAAGRRLRDRGEHQARPGRAGARAAGGARPARVAPARRVRRRRRDRVPGCCGCR